MLCSLQNSEIAPLSWLRWKLNLLTPILWSPGLSRGPFSIPWKWEWLQVKQELRGHSCCCVRESNTSCFQSALQTGLGLGKGIPWDFRWHLVCGRDDLPTELITGHPKQWAFWTIQALRAFFLLLPCQVCLSFIVTARKTRIRQMPVLLVLLIIPFEVRANFIWLITGPKSVTISVFSLSSKSPFLEAE